eukprot:scaffold16119_cov162-Amphora_coffeaeformis.AAC.7
MNVTSRESYLKVKLMSTSWQASILKTRPKLSISSPGARLIQESHQFRVYIILPCLSLGRNEWGYS